MDVKLSIGNHDKSLIKFLLGQSYKGWSERDVIETLAAIGLHEALVERTRWELADVLQRGREHTIPEPLNVEKLQRIINGG